MNDIGGFSGERWRLIGRLIATFKPYDRLVLFGSRAKGNFREGSDVDLAVWGMGWDIFLALRVKDALEEEFFPWSFDVVVPDLVSEPALIDHIDRVGIEIM